MAYEIPQNLKYSEKILFNLTFSQLAWVGLFGGMGAVVFLKTALPFEIKVAAAVFFALLAAGFAFFGLGTHLKNFATFKASIGEAGYFDPRINKFIEVERISDDTVYLKDGMLAVVQVTPINFSILEQEQQRAIVRAFSDFLNSLDFPIQIVMRTVNLSIDDYLSHLEGEVKALKKEQLLEQFNSFQEFMRGFIEENAVKNRLFYIIIPYSPSFSANVLRDIFVNFRNLFSREKQKTTYELNSEIALNQLAIRAKLCQGKLKACNLSTRRLGTGELTSLLASYFEGFVEAGGDYVSAVTVLDEFGKAKGGDSFGGKNAHGQEG
ncbi:MAG: PrgI family protein [Candidatus Diapherotrites archaeon]